MKKIIAILALGVAATLVSCDKESENHSFVTLLPSVELKGDDVVLVNLNDSYTDEGADVFIGTEPQTNFDVESDVNTAEVGSYSVSYSMTNKDGYSASASRAVYVTDPTFQTKWYSVININRDGAPKYKGVVIWFEKVDDTHFKCEDFLGGYYIYGVGYASVYSAPGVFEISAPDADGWAEIKSYEGGKVAGWGDAIDGLTGKFNVNNGKFHFHTKYAGKYDFEPFND